MVIFFLEKGWENDISQMECTGESNGKAPFVSKNHAARCGYINKFDYGSGSCQINSFWTDQLNR